jgi:adenylosuccinate synthase
MPATVVVGGQYGSEGKGKVVALMAARVDRPWLVRCGGPNSGHTVTINGTDVILRQVPSCMSPKDAIFCIGAGSVIDERVLFQELDLLGVNRDSVIVDPRAVLATQDDRDTEIQELQEIASTFSGTGAALMRRMSRRPGVALVSSSETIRRRCRVETVAPHLHEALRRREHVIVEGSQGFGLSLLHGGDYPFVTSRDTTAAGFAMEVGLSPRMVDGVVLVVRTFPIRVGGNSGPLKHEIGWEDVRSISGAPEVVPEFTSVTKRLRRVAHFDIEAVRLACQYNMPTSLAVMGLDRLDHANTAIRDIAELTHRARAFIKDLERATNVPVEFIGTGFSTLDAIVLPLATRATNRAHA